jgi:hypothetical protein
MKVHITGKTPMERLANFTRGILAVEKADVEKLDKEWHDERKKRKRKRKKTS